MKINIERYGQGAQSAQILFIHGSGGNTRLWQKQADYLQSFMEVILVNLPGHGNSSDEGCDSVEEYTESVYSAIREQKITNCYIAGHSLGGAIAMTFALLHPEMIKGIILLGTGAKLRVLPQVLESIKKNKAEAVKDIVNLAFSKNAPLELKNDVLKEMMKCEADVIFKDFKACDNFNIIDSLHLLNLPCLIVCGTDDSLTPMKYSEYLCKNIKDSKLVPVKEAGHIVMMEKPEEVNSAIENFIKSRQ